MAGRDTEDIIKDLLAARRSLIHADMVLFDINRDQRQATEDVSRLKWRVIDLEKELCTWIESRALNG